jgi:hypothetical protein
MCGFRAVIHNLHIYHQLSLFWEDCRINTPLLTARLFAVIARVLNEANNFQYKYICHYPWTITYFYQMKTLIARC